ncbi:hypothetical protein BCL69_103212 [Nitrosomonas communis]|uniref:Uncharacterized protein n=1 Tax=Nitrosomonas communis TaxID=44574 RepID=A0A5D3YAN4_9PROT|nr:hypothetical protein BCL69_103212 [Nitrosomonas communis]
MWQAREQELVNRLAGQRTQTGAKQQRSLRLIKVTEEAEAGNPGQNKVRWVNLIHETLIHSKNTSGEGNPPPYWPTLWQYIEQHKEQAAQHEHLARCTVNSNPVQQCSVSIAANSYSSMGEEHNTRKPIKLKRRTGMSKSRETERALNGLLYQEPPRKTRSTLISSETLLG